MADQEMQTADALARVTLPAAFADAKVIVEMVGPSEVRIRKVDAPADELSTLPENRIAVLSDRDRDRFLKLLASPPAASAALRKAMKLNER
jgi:nucleoside-triphosphatase THEP1